MINLKQNRWAVYLSAALLFFLILFFIQQINRPEPSAEEVATLFIQLIQEQDEAVYGMTADPLHEGLDVMLTGRRVQPCLGHNLLSREILPHPTGVEIACEHLEGRTKKRSRVMLVIQSGTIIDIVN